MSEQRQQLANNLLNILQQKKGESKGISDIPIPMRKPFANVEAQEKLGDVEMRADLDPYTSNSPLAKLGYKLFEDGKTRLKFPYGRHNANPSRAVDVVPYPIDWDDRERFHLFAGFVLGIAQSMEINIRWGGDWNKNFEVDDNNFDDFPHFELMKDF